MRSFKVCFLLVLFVLLPGLVAGAQRSEATAPPADPSSGTAS